MRAYTEKSNLLAKQRFYEEMAPNDLSRAFYIHKSGNVLGWRIVRRGGAALSYDAGNRSFSPFDVLPEDKAVNLVPYDYINGKITAVNESVRTADERPESFYLGNVKVMNTPDGLMCQLPGSSDYTPLRTDISDIKEGDAFVAGPINAWSRSRESLWSTLTWVLASCRLSAGETPITRRSLYFWRMQRPALNSPWPLSVRSSISM